MELVKKSGNYQIFKKRSGRYCVRGASGYLRGEDKTQLLLKAGLIRLPAAKAKPKPEAASEEA